MRLLMVLGILTLCVGCVESRKPAKENEISQAKLEEALTHARENYFNDPNMGIRCLMVMALQRELDTLKNASAGPIDINDSLLGLKRSEVLNKLGAPIITGCPEVQNGEIVDFMFYCNIKAVDLDTEENNDGIKIEPLILVNNTVVAYGWKIFDEFTVSKCTQKYVMGGLPEKTRIQYLKLLSGLGCK